EVNATINTPWSVTTASDKHSYGTVNAYLVRTESSVSRTALAAGGEMTVTSKKTFDPASGLTLTEEQDAAGQKDCVRTEYAPNTEAWILNLPKRVEKVSTGCSQTPVRTGDPKTTDVVSDVRATFDNQAWGAAPTKGDVTRTQRVTGYTTAGAAELQTVSTATYDALGRPVDQFDSAGTRTKHAQYTPAVGGPLTRTVESNALGHTVTNDLSPEWGLRTLTIDPNGNRTELAYDALGRLTDV
ncbi:hypothetical protein G3M53_79070, partial [Streptomyces sp. SID7982]|nr:hypothetical protein [Streptomyces sp. SID7982]